MRLLRRDRPSVEPLGTADPDGEHLGPTSAADLGTTKRPDGTTQVTYGGHPLYRYAGDTATGQTGGQGSKAFGGAWYVVSPSGKAIDPSRP